MYAIYLLLTGQILRIVRCNDPGQAIPDDRVCSAVEVDESVSDATHYIDPQTHQAVRFPTKPSRFCAWDWVQKEWRDPRSVDDLKRQKNAEINAARLAANRSTFNFAGKAIACDELSRGDIDGINGIVALTKSLPPGFPGGWKAVDNTYVSITDVATWVAFYGAMVQQGTANFIHAQQLKAQLAAASTPIEVQEVPSW